MLNTVELAPLEYRTTRGRMALYALGALGFVLFGVWLGLRPEEHLGWRVFGWLSVAFFGLCLVVYLAEMVTPRIVLWLDEEGVHSAHPLAANCFSLPWKRMRSVRVVGVKGPPLVVFDADDPDWGLDDLPIMTRATKRANRTLVGSTMMVAPRLYRMTAEALVAEIERRRVAATGGAVQYPRPHRPL